MSAPTAVTDMSGAYYQPSGLIKGEDHHEGSFPNYANTTPLPGHLHRQVSSISRSNAYQRAETLTIIVSNSIILLLYHFQATIPISLQGRTSRIRQAPLRGQPTALELDVRMLANHVVGERFDVNWIQEIPSVRDVSRLVQNAE